MKKLYALLAFAALALQGIAQTYTQTTVVTGMQYPVAFDVAPDGRFFCTWKGDGLTPASPGTAVVKVYNNSGTLIGTFCDLSDSVNSDFERGLIGITLDPDFANNHYVYMYYNHYYSGDERIRIVRFTENNNVGQNPTIIFDLDVPESIAGNHVGGNVHFRPSDPNHIYFTIGDLAYQQTNPTLNYGNKLTVPFGKHLRIGTSGTNVVPTDNPFYDDGNPLTGNCDYIWSYGHRNPFDFCFSPVSDSMYSSENGLNAWDEMNMIHKGSFYGWADCEGNYVNSSTTTPCNLANDVLPIEVWGSPLPAVTGILYYSSQVMPEFDNHVLVADNDYGRVYDVTLGNAPVYDQFVSRTQWMDMTTTGGLTTIKQGTDGCVYAMKGGYTTNGQIYRVCPQGLYVNDEAQDFMINAPAPNPVSDRADLNFYLANQSQVSLNLFDMTGRQVASLASGNMSAGSHIVGIDVDALGLSSGTYIASLSVGGLKKTAKLVVAK